MKMTTHLCNENVAFDIKLAHVERIVNHLLLGHNIRVRTISRGSAIQLH